MRAKNFLTPQQKKTLQKALKDSSIGQVQHYLILLLRNEGKTYQEIAEFLGISYRTVAYWCAKGDPNNLETLRDRRTQGNYRKATPEYKELLFQIALKSPKTLGYTYPRWTKEKLAQHMADVLGISLSSSQIGNLLRQNKKHN